MIQISVDLTHPKFAAMTAAEQKSIAVSIAAPCSDSPHLGYAPYPLNLGTVGDFAVNARDYMVTKRRPLVFSREAFTIFGNITTDAFLASKMGQYLATLVEQGIVVVTDLAGPTALTPAQILTFVA